MAEFLPTSPRQNWRQRMDKPPGKSITKIINDAKNKNNNNNNDNHYNNKK